jgi:hypothetical protein
MSIPAPVTLNEAQRFTSAHLGTSPPRFYGTHSGNAPIAPRSLASQFGMVSITPPRQGSSSGAQKFYGSHPEGPQVVPRATSSRVISQQGSSPATRPSVGTIGDSRPVATSVQRPTSLASRSSESPYDFSSSRASGAQAGVSPPAVVRNEMFTVSFTNERFLPLLRELKRIQHRDEVL